MAVQRRVIPDRLVFRLSRQLGVRGDVEMAVRREARALDVLHRRIQRDRAPCPSAGMRTGALVDEELVDVPAAEAAVNHPIPGIDSLELSAILPMIRR